MFMDGYIKNIVRFILKSKIGLSLHQASERRSVKKNYRELNIVFNNAEGEIKDN